ncbi:MAG: ABC transporter permease subunit [Anaerolineae bacterium]|jgi:peptide/nickel transport system permease protein
MKPQTLWQRVSRAVRDRSFIIGTALVACFILLAVLGPEVAPHNPFSRDRIQTIDGELQRAPFSPSEQHPLGTDDQGRDLLSLLLYGARQTLVIAFVAMTIRLLIGLILGTFSGWWPNSLFDRAVTSVTEFLAAIPALILAILLVFAVGIRRGQIAFIIALSFIGWGEIAQIVRGHVLTLRDRLFVLASQSLGLSQSQILSRHILPNLLATLLALAALEMGGVLLILGELGFVHIFIGGGGIYVDDAVDMGHVVHFFEVPDWGAMLGTSWPYFRSMPWLPLAPAISFFVAILGFNLFGYGLQRFIEKGRFHPSGWSVLRFFVVVGLVLWGAQALLASSSIESQYAKMAEDFNLQRAWDDVAYLSRPELQGRPSGPGGGHAAASYIASQFEQADLTEMTWGNYYQTYTGVRGHVVKEPSLTLFNDQEPQLQLREGLSFSPYGYFQGSDVREEELVIIGNADRQYPLDKIALVLSSRDSGFVRHFPGADDAVLLTMVPDEDLWRPDVAPIWIGPFGGLSFDPESNMRSRPDLLISETATRQLLSAVGLDLDALMEELEAGEEFKIDTGARLSVEAGLFYEEVNAVNVVGYIPGADQTSEGDRILVTAPYWGPTPHDSTIFPGADENASGVAVMLEVARLWRDIGFVPGRTVVFAALDVDGGRHLVNHPPVIEQIEDTWTEVDLRGLAAGEEALYRYEAGGGLARAFDQSARRFRVDTEPMDGWRFAFNTGWGQGDEAYSGLAIYRPGDDLSGTAEDTIEHLDPQLLMDAGQSVAHYLMVLSSR